MHTQVNGTSRQHAGTTLGGLLDGAFSRTALCLLGLAGGCAADTGVTDVADSENVEETSAAVTRVEGGIVNARLMHTVDMGNDHHVQFFNAGGGTYGVREIMRIEDEKLSVIGNDGFKAIYRRARPGITDQEMPLDIRQADERVVTGPMSSFALPETAESETGGLATLSQGLAAQCSTDVPGGDFGATWFLQNHCIGGQIRQCVTNRAHAVTQKRSPSVGFVRGEGFISKVMEGDFAVPGRSRGWFGPPGWKAESGIAPTFLWDVVVAPRRIEVQSWTGPTFSNWRSIGDSPCGHSHAAFLMNGV